MYRTILLALALAGAACSPTASPTDAGDVTATSPPGEAVALRRVLDGDSLQVERPDGSVTEVRLLGINAPEADECHGDAARDSLRSLLDDTGLTLVTGDDEVDQFGRLLRYVYADGVNVNLELAAGGDALALQSGHELEGAFVDSAGSAAAADLGLWSTRACGSAEIPRIEIADYEYDPPGRDAANANGEYVEIRNNEDTVVELSGWIVRDESSQHRFAFPGGAKLDPGGSVVVRSGCGTPSATEFFWCATDPVWSNGGDTVIVQLPDGTIVAWEQFAGDF